MSLFLEYCVRRLLAEISDPAANTEKTLVDKVQQMAMTAKRMNPSLGQQIDGLLQQYHSGTIPAAQLGSLVQNVFRASGQLGSAFVGQHATPQQAATPPQQAATPPQQAATPHYTQQAQQVNAAAKKPVLGAAFTQPQTSFK